MKLNANWLAGAFIVLAGALGAWRGLTLDVSGGLEVGKPLDPELAALMDAALPPERITGPRLVILWAPWCGPCVQELRWLAGTDMSMRSRLALLSVDDPAESVELLRELGLGHISLRHTGDVARRYAKHAIPCTIAIDSRGVITHVITGYGQDTTPAKLRAIVQGAGTSDGSLPPI